MAVHGLGRRGLELYSQMTLPEPEMAGEVVKQLDYSPVLGLMRAHGVDADRLAEWVFGGAVEVSKVARGLSDSGVPVPVAVQRAALVFGPADSGGALQVLSKPGWMPAAYEDAGLRVVVPWAASQSDSISKEWIVRLDDRLFVNRDEQGRFAAVARPSQPAVAMEGAQAVALGGAGAEDPEVKRRSEREAAEEAQRKRKAVLRRREAAGAQREAVKRRKKAREERRAKEKKVAETGGGGPGAEQKKEARRKRRRSLVRRMLAGDVFEVPPPKAHADPEWDNPDDRVEFKDLMGGKNYLMTMQSGYFQVPLEMVHEAYTVTSRGDVTRTNQLAARERATRLRVATLQKHLGGDPVRFHLLRGTDFEKIPLVTRDDNGVWMLNVSTKYGLVYTNGVETGQRGLPFYVHPSVNVLFGNEILSGSLFEVLRTAKTDPDADEWDFPDSWVKPIGQDAFNVMSKTASAYLDVGQDTVKKAVNTNLSKKTMKVAMAIKKVYGLPEDEPLLGNLWTLEMNNGMGNVIDGKGMDKKTAFSLDVGVILELARRGELGKHVDADALRTSQTKQGVAPSRRRVGVDARDKARVARRADEGGVTLLSGEGEQYEQQLAPDREIALDSATTRKVKMDEIPGSFDVRPLRIIEDLRENPQNANPEKDINVVMEFEEGVAATEDALKGANEKGTNYTEGFRLAFDVDGALAEMASGTVVWPDGTTDEVRKASREFTAIGAAMMLAAAFNNDPTVEGAKFSEDGTENVTIRFSSVQDVKERLEKWQDLLGNGAYQGIVNALGSTDGYREAVRVINRVNADKQPSFRKLFRGLNVG